MTTEVKVCSFLFCKVKVCSFFVLFYFAKWKFVLFYFAKWKFVLFYFAKWMFVLYFFLIFYIDADPSVNNSENISALALAITLHRVQFIELLSGSLVWKRIFFEIFSSIFFDSAVVGGTYVSYSYYYSVLALAGTL